MLSIITVSRITLQYYITVSRESDGMTTCDDDVEKLVIRCDLLVKYMNNNTFLQLQALFALQAFVHHLDHPSGE